MKKALLGALVILAATAVQASAITIDFRNSSWNPGSNDNSITVGNTTVSSAPSNSSLYWDSTNGFGVNTRNDESSQIEENERLNVTFSTAFRLTSFSLNRLFDSEDGYYSLNGGAWTKFGGSNDGDRTVTLPPTWVTTMSFGFPTSYNGGDAFFVEQLTGDFQTQQTPTVPEPTSMVLLGTGLLGLVARARRKQSA